MLTRRRGALVAAGLACLLAAAAWGADTPAEKEVPPPSHVRADVPPHLDAVVMRALQKSPDARYQTAAEMAEALAAIARQDGDGREPDAGADASEAAALAANRSDRRQQAVAGAFEARGLQYGQYRWRLGRQLTQGA